MNFTPYQIGVPILSILAILYAWNLAVRQKKTIWEALLWTFFWGAISAIAIFPDLLGYLTAVTGIKSQVNAILATSIGILFFLIFYVVLRIEELSQKHTRIVRALALRDMEDQKEERQ